MSEWGIDVLQGERGRTPRGFLDTLHVVCRVEALSEDVRGGGVWNSLKLLIKISQIIATPMIVCTTSARTSIPTCSSQWARICSPGCFPTYEHLQPFALAKRRTGIRIKAFDTRHMRSLGIVGVKVQRLVGNYSREPKREEYTE